MGFVTYAMLRILGLLLSDDRSLAGSSKMGGGIVLTSVSVFDGWA